MFSEKVIEFYKELGAVFDNDGKIRRYHDDLKLEYEAVRSGFGIFDKSDTCFLSMKGDEASEHLDMVVSGNVRFLEYNHILNTAILDKDGGLIDLISIYRDVESLLISVSAERKEKVMKALNKNIPDGVSIRDLSDKYALLTVEGVYSWECVKEIGGADITGLRLFAFLTTSFQNIPELIVARGGTTGEYGFRLLFPKEYAVDMLTFLRDFETDRNKEFCGKDVVEILSQEVRMPIMGIGIREGDNLIEKGLSWMIDWQKDEYVGKEKMDATLKGDYEKTVGYVCDKGCGVELVEGDPVFIEDEQIGEVLTNVYSFKMEVRFGFVMLKKEWACVGIDEYVVKKGDKEVSIHTVSTPFFLSESIQVQMV